MRPSRRYLVPAVALCLLAAVPVWSDRLRPPPKDPCHDPQALRDVREIPGTGGTSERLDDLTRDLFQWTEAPLLDERGDPSSVRVHVVRDYQGSRFFHRPFGLAGPMEPEAQTTRRVESEAGELVVHRVSDGSARMTGGVERFAAYTFLYGNRPVESAVRSKLLHAGRELVQGRRPLTLLLVAGPAPAGRSDALIDRAERWLRDAAARHVAVCSESP